MVEINNTTKKRVDIKRLMRIAETFLASQKKPAWDLSIALVGDRRMRAINRDFRGHDVATDVLSFAGEARQKYFGEVVISLDQVKRPNKYDQVLPVSERRSEYILPFILVHGLLHLVGYNDESDAERLKMVSLGREFLAENRCKWYNPSRK